MTSSMTTLDVTCLPFEASYLCSNGTTIDLAKLLADIRPAIEALAATSLIKSSSSFGFAMLAPRQVNEGDFEDFQLVFDQPEEYIWFVGGWGADRNRYIANAVRKLRPLIRHRVDSTLAIRSQLPLLFAEVVPSVDTDGNFPWGDFPWAGATSFEVCDILFEGAVSALHEVEDDFVARLIMTMFAKQIIAGDRLLPDA